MVSTSTRDPNSTSYRHDLVLAFNFAQSPHPFIFRLSPQTPNVGNGPSGVSSGSSNSSSPSAWTLTDQSQSFGTTSSTSYTWLASGTVGQSISASPEGSALYEILTAPSKVTLQKLDVSGSSPIPSLNWPVVITFFDDAAEPRILRLSDRSGMNDVVVIGSCTATPTTPQGACLVLLNEVTFDVISTNMPYDPTACYTEANGSVIMASTAGIWTVPYTSITSTSTWINRQPPGLLPNLPTSILACAVTNSKLYAVLQGNSGMPSIRAIDLTSLNWDWQTVQLAAVPSGDLNSGQGNNSPGAQIGGSNDNNVGGSGSKKGLSTAVLIVIIVVIVILLLLLGLLFLWRYRRNKRKAGSHHAQGLGKTIVAPAPIIPAPVPGSGYSPYTVPSPATTLTPSGAAFMAPPHPSQAPVRGGSSGSMDKQEFSEYSQSSQQSAAAPVAYTSTQPTAHIPISAASAAMTGVAPNIYSPTRLAGDKQELRDSEDFSVFPGSGLLSLPTSNSASAPTAVNANADATVPRRQQMMVSPGLANAQLILQNSQAPTHQQPHLTKPQGGAFY
ncbi:hypothetical protein EDD11_002543 [Mortierella claussenii]|nr:hypothetical protein EDD11_002543 [Mortierella claussenii]